MQTNLPGPVPTPDFLVLNLPEYAKWEVCFEVVERLWHDRDGSVF